MVRCAALFAAALAVFGMEAADAASIGIFSSDDCTSCTLTIGAEETSTLYIAAVGSQGGGVVGATFAITGLPIGWVATATPAPSANVAIGDPFGSGAVIGFPAQQHGTCILLYTVSLHSPAGQPGVSALTVGSATMPGFPQDCPTLRICRPECDFVPPDCVSGGALLINSPCNVGVARTTWSAIRGVFR